MRIVRLVPLLAGAFAAASASAQVQGQEPAPAPAAEEAPRTAAEFTTGVEYEEGNYFTGERIETLSVQNVLRVRLGRVNLGASLPWHRIEAPGNVVGGGLIGLPIIVDPTQPATRSSRSGLGDLRLGAGVGLPRLAGFDLTLTGEVKLPTASRARGIGTGETDFSVGGELSRTMGAVTPFAAVSYTMPGDPEDYTLRNSLAARGGLAVRLSERVRGSVSYGYAESISPAVPDEQQLSTGLSAQLSRTLSLGLYGSAGLSDGAADLGGGLSLGVRLF